MGISRADLDSYRDRTVPDLVGPGLAMLVVGINPGLWTAATGLHFAHPGNRFWPAMRSAGIIDREIPRGQTLSVEDEEYLVARGLGITNLVARATAKASELGAAELRAGAVRLEAFVASHRPVVVAVAGVTAYRTAFGRPRAVQGRQPEAISDVPCWVVPNPSGLNAHETIASLAAAYREPAVATGVISG